MTLRLATEADREDIRRMALAFKAESPYAGIPHTKKKLEHVISSFINGDKTKLVAILAVHEGKPVGMVAGVVSEFIWNEDVHASEIVWWLDPKYRRDKLGLELKEAYEYWAWKVGCSHTHMSLLNDKSMDRLERFYRRNGYEPMERSYLKRIR
jgi:GNAT superfamily N-acetyltransferase